MILDVLSYIGEKLNKEDILWGVGASILLNHYGLVENPNDIDIMVHTKDIKKLDIVLKSLGEKKLEEKVSTYATEFFYEYVVKGIDVDVMAGFTINHNEGEYKYIFENNSISEMKNINGVNIPLTTLEDWYVIYQLIPNRNIKVKLIQTYLLENSVKRPELLERALEENLPSDVRLKIKNLMAYKINN
jgi:hypothetical protein